MCSCFFRIFWLGAAYQEMFFVRQFVWMMCMPMYFDVAPTKALSQYLSIVMGPSSTPIPNIWYGVLDHAWWKTTMYLTPNLSPVAFRMRQCNQTMCFGCAKFFYIFFWGICWFKFFDAHICTLFCLALTSCCCKVKDACHHVVAQVMGWSFQCATSGRFPAKGCFGETLSGQRAKLANYELAGGWKAAYFGSKYDAKARKETNRFPRSYMHSWICEACCAQRKHKDWNSCLTYKNFYPQAIHCMTPISS